MVEDEPEMAEILGQALTESGYAVTLAGDGREALARAAGHDLVVLDVMMPAMNGFEAARALRRDAHRLPILFLTARGSLDDRVKGLEIGDDYLLKPFALEELLARVAALLRRGRDAGDLLSYADLRLDRRSRRALRGATPLALSNTEFALLEAFLLSPGRPLSKAALLREVWQDDPSRDDNIVEVYVGYLRAKTETGGRARLIHTLRGVGYVLEARGP